MSKAPLKFLSVAIVATFAAAALANGTYTPPAVVTPTPVTTTNNNPSSTSGADAWAAGGNVGDVAGGAGGSVGPVSNTAQGGLGGVGGAGGTSASTSSAAGGLGGAGGSVGAVNSAGGNAAGGTSTSSAAGGTASAGDSTSLAHTGPSYAAAETGSIADNSNSKYLSLSLPQPVWTMVPQAFGCIVSSSQAGSLGWNFASGSTSKQSSDAVCTTVRMSEAATLHCQYATAAHLNKRAFEQMYDGSNGDFFLASNPKDLTLAECEAIKRPQLRAEPALVAPVVAPAPVACVAPKRVKRTFVGLKAAKKPACVNCCKS